MPASSGAASGATGPTVESNPPRHVEEIHRRPVWIVAVPVRDRRTPASSAGLSRRRNATARFGRGQWFANGQRSLLRTLRCVSPLESVTVRLQTQ